MRGLTLAEHETLERRRQGFESFVKEISPVLSDFADRLGLPNPNTIAANPEPFLEDIDEFMRDQVVTDESRIWIVARLAYFIGQILIQRFGGEWLLNERPDSRFFLQYVVGRFLGVSNPNLTVDPFAVAAAFLAAPPGRSLERIISEAEQEILSLWFWELEMDLTLVREVMDKAALILNWESTSRAANSAFEHCNIGFFGIREIDGRFGER